MLFIVKVEIWYILQSKMLVGFILALNNQYKAQH